LSARVKRDPQTARAGTARRTPQDNQDMEAPNIGANASLLVQLKQMYHAFPPTAKKIAAFIEHNTSDVIRMSITELAENTRSSEGSIVGLCRRLGASGFQDLKLRLARELVEPVQFIHEDLRPQHSALDVSERIFAAHAASLFETRKLLSLEALNESVELIVRAKRIEVYGIGSAAPVAEDLGYRLLQLGYDCKVLTDSHVQAVSAAMTGPDVATITVSHSGSSLETVMATRLAHEAGARTIGITRFGKSPLSRYCDIVLHTVANETRYRPEAMSSRVAQLAIVDTLVSCCALRDSDSAIANLQRAAQVLSTKRF